MGGKELLHVYSGGSSGKNSLKPTGKKRINWAKQNWLKFKCNGKNSESQETFCKVIKLKGSRKHLENQKYPPPPTSKGINCREHYVTMTKIGAIYDLFLCSDLTYEGWSAWKASRVIGKEGWVIKKKTQKFRIRETWANLPVFGITKGLTLDRSLNIF